MVTLAITWQLLGNYLVFLGLSGTNKWWKCRFGGDQFCGRLFGQRWGQLEGKSIVFVREGVQEIQFALNLFVCVPAPIFTPWNWCFGRMFPTIGPLSVPFPMKPWWSLHETFHVTEMGGMRSCWGHPEVTFSTKMYPWYAPVGIFCAKSDPSMTSSWPQHDISMASPQTLKYGPTYIWTSAARLAARTQDILW